MRINNPPIYEYGIWTPDLQFGGAKVGIFYVTQIGTYTKIGNLVIANAFLGMGNKGSSVGSAEIFGLPYPTKNDNCIYPAVIYPQTVTYTGTPLIYANANTSKLEVATVTEAGVLSALTNANFANGTNLGLTICYRTA